MTSKPTLPGNYILRCMEGDHEPEPVRIYFKDGILRADLPSIGDYDLVSIHDGLTNVVWEIIPAKI